MLKYKYQCHCACSSEIGIYIINDAGRQVAHKKQRKYTFYTHVLKVNINFQRKKKKLKKIRFHQAQRHYTFNHPVICKTVKYIDQLNNSSWHIHVLGFKNYM
jgi:hypothetical protein